MNGKFDRKPQYIDMTPAEWATIPDNSRQRDTALRAPKAISYLGEFRPPHALVDMAVLPDGQRIKLNGHTRCYLWMNGLIPVPQMLRVTIYPCNTHADTAEAYTWFDSAGAAERGGDMIQGAFKANGVRLETNWLRNGRIGTALRSVFLLYTKVHGTNWRDFGLVYWAVHYFADELRLFDSLKPSVKLFPPGIQMAVLLTLKHDDADAMEFWSLFAQGKGTKNGITMDAVQALIEAVGKSRSRLNTDDKIELFGKAMSAFQSFQSRATYSVGKGGLRAMQETSLKKYTHQERRIL
jgi:hypothetical protein